MALNRQGSGALLSVDWLVVKWVPPTLRRTTLLPPASTCTPVCGRGRVPGSAAAAAPPSGHVSGSHQQCFVGRHCCRRCQVGATAPAPPGPSPAQRPACPCPTEPSPPPGWSARTQHRPPMYLAAPATWRRRHQRLAGCPTAARCLHPWRLRLCWLHLPGQAAWAPPQHPCRLKP
jgi:hypothetical protein